jgi:hypothetical protein
VNALAAVLALHPGHGTTDPNSWAHYLTEPVHVLALAGIAAISVVVFAIGWRGERVRRR